MTACTVHKFGGTSVANAERVRNVAALVREHGGPSVVVVSAMAGVTNLLVRAIAAAQDGHVDTTALDEIHTRHREAAADLGVDPAETVEPLLAELAELIDAAAIVRGATPRLHDRIVVTGEKLSARLLAAHFNRDVGPARAVDADTFLETDGAHGSARPIAGVFESSTRSALVPLLDAGETPIVTGFCGRAPCGSTTTLGRGGSDYSATLIAAALGAHEVIIWTDVPGVYSAHPGIVPGAVVVPHLNYREAGELAYYGAKVLHPMTLQPLMRLGIPAIIRDSFRPNEPGTRIDGRTSGDDGRIVKGVSAVPGQALVSIEGTGMAGVPGIAARIFSTLAGRGISVTMISQSSSESSVCLAVPQDRASDAVVALREAFRMDLGSGDVEDVRMQPGVALVAAVGLGMAHAVGVAGRLFRAVADAGVSVRAIAQGASELNITFTVDQRDSDRAVRALHDAFVGSGDSSPGAHADIAIVGFGGVGREVAAMIESCAPDVASRLGVRPRVVAVADRSGFVHDPAGITAERLTALGEAKRGGVRLADMDGAVRTGAAADVVGAARPAVVIDAADGDTSGLYEAAFAHGADVVTANKAPLAARGGPRARVAELAASRGRRLMHEATVGAGLPVIEPIRRLIETGDRVRRIEGCLSGTLTYVLSRLDGGDAFGDVLEDARRNGYIEPNPMVDLSGEDVLRKAIILGRVCGFDVSDERIAHESLVSAEGSGQPSAEEVLALGADLVRRVEQARDAGKSLRYVATIDADGVRVGPRVLEKGSRFATLAGTDNLIAVTSDRYAESPLVISGPGAGAALTATAVMGDVLKVLAERGS